MTIRIRARIACAIVVLSSVALTACGGQSNGLPTSTVGNAASVGGSYGTARFVITIPPHATSNVRKPAYISPATQSITISLSGPTPESQTANLTPTSTGCSSTLASTQCTLSVTSLAPGAYTGAISTYDGANATGNVLSSNQNVAFSIVAGQANTIALTLNAVPHSLIVSSQSAAAAPTGNASFTISGIFPATLLVTALDADGNIIFGAGAPTYSITQATGNTYTIGKPTTTAPNTFTLFPPAGNGATASFTVTATYSDSTCLQTGAVCSTSIATKTHQQTMVVELGSGPLVYQWPYTAAGTALNGYGFPIISPQIATFEGNGNLYIGDSANSDVKEYAPPYTAAPIATIGSGSLGTPGPVIVGTNGVLFVGDLAYGVIRAYAPPYTGSPVLTISNDVSGPSGLAFDGSGDLFVANEDSGHIDEYAPPYTGTPLLLGTVREAGQVQVSSAGVVFAIGQNLESSIFICTPPYGSAIQLGSNNFSAIELAPDGSTLFAADDINNELDQIAPPYSSVSSQLGPGGYGSTALAFDAANDLFSAYGSASSGVSIFQPPYAGTPKMVSVGNPYGVFLSP